MTEQQTAAMRQALEWLEHESWPSFDQWAQAGKEVKAALRQALEQQPNGEPVAWDVFSKHGRIYFSIGNQSFPVDYTPEDEPDCSAGQAAVWYMDLLRHALRRLSENHPQPAAWVGLTDDDISTLYIAWDEMPGASWADFARAIEAKLREKNGGKA